jgi:hypothetical protein
MKHCILLFFLLYTAEVTAQERIIVKGKVTDAIDSRIAVPGCIIVNMRTQQGILAGEDGTFSIEIYKTDTLAFRTIGYQLRFISLRDSVVYPGKLLEVGIKRLSYQLDEVTIIPHRNLDSISKDISKLGYKASDYMLQDIDALSSPITYLYQAFSRKERSRREVAFMMNEDERKKLMKELLDYYVNAGFLPLRDRDYDEFISFCAISEAQLKTLTQYEMAVYIKKKYENFIAMKR